MSAFNPFPRGGFPVEERTLKASDHTRNREFSIEVWCPATAGSFPLVLYSHGSGGNRRMAASLCTHLSSHGYVVAALDHSEVVAPELFRREGETAEQRAARGEAWIANRVPDMQFLVKSLLDDNLLQGATLIDASRVGLIGFSFGGWTVLATPDVEARVHAIVALAPGGASQPKPGILPAKLRFDWGRDVPTLFLAGESDIFTPAGGIFEVMQRTPSTRRMISLVGADHMHFIDEAEKTHESVRKMKWTEELSWVPSEIRPFADLCPESEAQSFVRGVALAHMDAVLKKSKFAQDFLAGDIERELALHGIKAKEYRE